jgi:DNA mismatch repair ATPase MutS
VQAAREAPGSVLYLLDEVLQGTNSGDRRVAARTVLRHLLDADAIGAVTTHDLSLASAPDLEARAVSVHFGESVLSDPQGPQLAFDYLLRPGLATTRNALVLLEMVGLGPVEEPKAPS